jgi:hypothetical protein
MVYAHFLPERVSGVHRTRKQSWPRPAKYSIHVKRLDESKMKRASKFDNPFPHPFCACQPREPARIQIETIVQEAGQLKKKTQVSENS